MHAPLARCASGRRRPPASSGRLRRQVRADVRWEKKRCGQIDRGTAAPLPPTKPKKVSGQVTAVARGAERLLTPVEHFLLVDGELRYVGVQTDRGRTRRDGPVLQRRRRAASRVGLGRCRALPGPGRSVQGVEGRGADETASRCTDRSLALRRPEARDRRDARARRKPFRSSREAKAASPATSSRAARSRPRAVRARVTRSAARRA
jgi:hypothetical protein